MTLDNRIYRLSIFRTKPTATEKRFFSALPDGIVISGMQIQATIEKTLDQSPNKADVKLINLSPRTRAELQRDGVIVTLDAGHDGVARRLIGGDLTFGHSYREGTEWITDLTIGDGARAYAHARVKPRAYKAGTTVITVLREAAASMNLTLPRNVEISPELQTQFAGGWALNGRTRDELTRLLAPFGYTWSIQGGRLQILRDEEVRADIARVISEETGMIGSPIYGKPAKPGEPPKRSVRSLLYPELNPGAKVSIDSRQLEGIFKIEKVKHTLDFEGQDWTTEAEVKTV